MEKTGEFLIGREYTRLEGGGGLGLPTNLSGCGSPLRTFSHRNPS